jgi:hypothetical protein
MKPSRRDALLRLCLHAYPSTVRRRDGEALVDLAAELADGGSSPLREAVALLRNGAGQRAGSLLRGVAGAPWRDARAHLALPLTAALFAVAAVGVGRVGIAQGYWTGWSALVALGAAGVAVLGAAAGHRWLTAAGAFAITGMLALDALRDTYGRGSRWNTEVGSALVDVLVMWLPAALLLIACAGAVTRASAEAGIRRAAWALVPGAALVILASEPTRVVVADRIVLFGGFAVTAAIVALSLARRRTDPVLGAIAALLMVAAAWPALWLVAAFLPPPADGASALALAYWAAGALPAAAGAAALARSRSA